MSFSFNWTEFSTEFKQQTKTVLERALNNAPRPGNICDTIQVQDLCFGTVAPDLEMIEIGELTNEKFRAIFRLAYQGDAHLVLQTKVQANPVGQNFSRKSSVSPHRNMVAAHKPLVVPMQLKISNLRLKGIINLVICKHRGVTLCFKTDPLENVLVSSTFDNLPTIRRFLQNEIEFRLRKLFNEDLPVLIHDYSLSKVTENAAIPLRRVESSGSLKFETKSEIHEGKFSVQNGVMHRFSLADEDAQSDIFPLTASSSFPVVLSIDEMREFLEFEQVVISNSFVEKDKENDEPYSYVIDVNKNSVARDMKRLRHVHCTLSPYTRDINHVTFRTHPFQLNHQEKQQKMILKTTTQLSNLIK